MQGLSRLPRRAYSKDIYPLVKICLGAEAGKERNLSHSLNADTSIRVAF